VGDADLALAGPVSIVWDRLDARTLFTEPFVLIVPAGHRLAAQKSVTLDDIRQERLLVRTYCELSEAMAARLSSEGVPGGHHHHQVASERDLISLLDNKMGVALAPRSTAITASLRRRPVADLNVSRTVSLYSVAGRPRTAAASALMRQLLAADWQLERA
jgi:DNA-binding transcriptional LysR family regulator